jgi:hypothetical protein
MIKFEDAHTIVAEFYIKCKENKINCKINTKKGTYDVEIYD